jgi:transcriptional regulator with XRE-family HTH domain
MSIGERLKIARDSAKMTQQQVAEALGIERAAYTAYESNRRKPSIEKLAQLSVLFNVTSDYLLGLSNDLSQKTQNTENIDIDELLESGEAIEISEDQLKDRLPPDIRDIVTSLIKIEIEKIKKN